MLEEPEHVVGLWTVQCTDSMAVSCSLFLKSPAILFSRKSMFFLKTKADTEISGFLTFYGFSMFTLSSNMAPHAWLVV